MSQKLCLYEFMTTARQCEKLKKRGSHWLYKEGGTCNEYRSYNKRTKKIL